MTLLRIAGFLLTVTMFAAACGPLPGVASNTRLQGPVVPTRALPSPTPTATVTPEPTPTLVPPETPAVTEPALATSIQQATAEATEPGTPESEQTPVQVAGYSVARQVATGDTVQDAITTRQPRVLYAFRAEAGQTVDLAMSADSGNLDPFLIVLDSEGREVARNDDRNANDISAHIHNLTFSDSGDYLIVASRFGQRFGQAVGDFTLHITDHDPSSADSGTFAEVIAYGDTRSATITNVQPEYIYVFEATAGDLVTMQAAATSGNLDTSLTLTDHLGNTIAHNDDDVANTSTDAILRELLIPNDGYYSIVVSRYQGPNGTSAGDFRLRLTLEAQDAHEGGRLQYAVLNPVASGTVREDGSLYTDYYVGDRLDDDNEERQHHVLLTFALPERGDETAVESAQFEPGGCSLRGTGMRPTPLVVYDDPFDTALSIEALAQVGAAAEELGRLTSCTPLDVSEAVERAYSEGDGILQLRLVLADPPQNRDNDAVGLGEPRLRVRFEQPPVADGV